ncbi:MULTISPECIES: hypothetical protein [unclassified Chryseobacterium]|uniref:hypothetical protein n=1 Tax=unclassified Chryseobacterium TaxID=2593645 RepID=UPI0028533147|nr:hypothetical protein [Chryseobacterium sp. CFS7]MDR4892289.1 hypothetical protein [Chryseobacterium sp. CFS7]
MTSLEYTEYNRLTDEMELDFVALSSSFMGYCEEIIFGCDYPEIRYYCFHLYNDNYTKNIFSKLSCRIGRLLTNTDQNLYPNLFDGFSNLLIYLKEPIVRENDEQYRKENYDFWREKVCLDTELAKSGSFLKYLVEADSEERLGQGRG